MNNKRLDLCITIFLIALLFISCNQQQQDYSEDLARYSKELYIASSHSDKFHYRDCKWTKAIKPENAVYFTYEDAVKAGYKPCKTCNPKPE